MTLYYIQSFQRRKGINSHSKETDTYYLKSDLIVIKETIDNIKQQKENTKIHEKNKAKALALETKEADKARKLHEKEVAKVLALEAKEVENARKLHEKEVVKALALEAKEAKEAEKVRKLHEKEVTKVLALEAKEAEKVCKLHEKVKFKSEGLNIETSKAEATLRKKMKGYKTRISDGENIKVLFLTALEELEYIDVDILQNKTFKSWLDFLTRKLNTTSTNGKTLYKKFCRYLSLTKSNYENYFFVKLPMLSSKELNTMFFNTSNRIGLQEEIYTFLKFYSKFNDVKYKFQDLKNPHEAKRQITQRNQDKKEIYSITDYIKLIEFASDISTHKKEIEYWYQTKSSSKIRYRSYQSIWLYLILSLNNMWRNFDILTKVPMITLPARFTTFEAYFKNDLTADEAKIIFVELTSKYKTFKSSKTDKDSHFFCSEELILPLANALIACILYKQQSGQIFVIEQTKEFTLAPIMQDIFFSKFEIPNFKFKSKKMNSTLATYSYEYVKNYTNENPLLVTRLMRPHTDINTTNNYIHLSKENFNQITKNLFEGGYFGYTIDYMYRLITNEKSNLLDIDKKNYIITLFKDANKIKNISSQLLFIEKKYKSLHEYLNSLHKDDIEYQLNLITLKQLPAKEEHWQCILGECLYLNRSCISCPFAIPHFYSLTNCMEQLVLLVNKYKALNNESSNEKTFLSNRIFQYLLYLSDAKKEFGSEFINEFSDGNFNLLLEEISNLTDITNFIKIGRGGS